MSHNELLTQILLQPPWRSRLADVRASLQQAQALAEREWERQAAINRGDGIRPAP